MQIEIIFPMKFVFQQTENVVYLFKNERENKDEKKRQTEHFCPIS